MKTTLSLFLILFHFSSCLFAQKNEQELIDVINSTKIDTIKINRLIDLVEINFNNDLRKVQKNIELIHQLSYKSDYQIGLNEYINLKGKYHLYNNEFDSSIYWYKKFYKTRYVQNNMLRKINSLNNIGNSFSAGNQLDSAYFYLNQSLNLALKHDSKDICSIFNNLGLVVAKQSNYTKAIEYFELAHKCYVDKNQTPASQTLINLASLYSFTNNPQKDAKIKELLASSKDALSRNELLTLYLNLGLIYNESNESKLARIYLNKADSINSIYSKTPMPNILHGLANSEIIDKNYRKALDYFQKIYHDFPLYSERLILIRDLAKLNFDLGNYETGKKFYEELLNLKDSIYHTEIENTLLKAQKDVDFYKKEIQVKDLELEKQQLKTKRNQERIGGLLLSLLFLLVITWIWIFYKKEKAKRKINELEIFNKSQKLQEFHEKIKQRNKVIAEIENSFEQYKITHSVQEDLKQTIIDSLEIKGDNDVYNYYFEDQHKGFYTALKNLAPELTNNELRLCSLTKLRMSLKETAHILNLSVDAIKSGRYRIKKKLNLDPEVNLADYLNDLNH